MHSVMLASEKCIGCTDCIKRCPTEAIRVKASKAKIIDERCIDCGNCIAVCRNGAKRAVTDKLEMIWRYPHRVALPAPAFYAQFPKAHKIENILDAFYEIGFTDVVEVAAAAEIIAKHTRNYLHHAKVLPVISSACPVIVKLIQRRFPTLIEHVLPIISPMELAARITKDTYAKKGIDPKDVGVFFISPCPAKVTDVRNPKGIEQSLVDGALSMQDVYKAIIHKVKSVEDTRSMRQGSHEGLMWATRNGAISNVGIENHIAVDGMDNIIAILEKVEDGTLENVAFIEALGCVGGCLGGPLTIENPFVSRHTLKKFIDQEKKLMAEGTIKKEYGQMDTRYCLPIVPRPVFSLDENVATALTMMESIDQLYQKLPRIDCGSCGAPTCRCFAEDVIKGNSHVEDCIFMLRHRIKELSEAMLELALKVLPTEENKEVIK
ncbi:MAG: [Fe-Fe] hydrogenase large subunit C-terminal domain-containing protein [Cellulosilyticaceae bacterium]